MIGLFMKILPEEESKRNMEYYFQFCFITGSQAHWKIIYSIVLYLVFYEYIIMYINEI